MTNIKDNITGSISSLRVSMAPSPFSPKISLNMCVEIENRIRRGFRLLARRSFEDGRVKVHY